MGGDELKHFAGTGQTEHTALCYCWTQCIPKKVLPPKRRNRPWLNKSISQSIRRKNATFKRAKNTNSPRLWMHYKCIRNRVSSQLCLAKKKFFNSLNLSNPKSFWKSVKALDKRDTSTCALTHDGSPCLTDQHKTNAKCSERLLH